MANGHGGARPNSGPEKGAVYRPTLEKQAIRDRIREIVAHHLDGLVESQVAQAAGIKYLVKRDPETGQFERIGPEGIGDGTGIEVWEKDPSTAAFTDLMNRAADKPVEAVNLTHSGGITITCEIE